MWQCLIVTCACVNLYAGGAPSGSYSAVVRVPLLPTQKITITMQERDRAMIRLSGVINIEESFAYARLRDEWNVTFGEEIGNTLRKWHFSLTDMSFDSRRNVASVRLRHPLIGTRDIVLEHERSH